VQKRTSSEAEKKGQPYHIGLPSADFPHFSKNRRALRKLVRFQQTQTVLALFPPIFSKFDKVMMGL
jgi:hypothetical protein